MLDVRDKDFFLEEVVLAADALPDDVFRTLLSDMFLGEGM